jgi:hypothetical protein
MKLKKSSPGSPALYGGKLHKKPKVEQSWRSRKKKIFYAGLSGSTIKIQR